jgi:excisionase family DNA binding protein
MKKEITIHLEGLAENIEECIQGYISTQHLNKNPKWITTGELCQLLNISKRTAQNYRDKGLIPFSRFGGKIFYDVFDVQSALAKHQTQHTLLFKL